MYLLIALVCGGLSLVASLYVQSAFRRGAQVPLHSGLSGADVARRILRREGITNVEVQEHQGFLSDHYNPMDKILNLSPEVYNGSSAASAGVAAHEVGHALQHAQGDLSMWGRTILVYPAHFGSMLGPLLVMLGIDLAAAQGGMHAIHAGGAAAVLAWAGVGIFALATLCSLIIVGNEFNASARAKDHLVQLGIVDSTEELSAVRSVLTAAGLTYVAAAVGSIVQLIYWAFQAGLIGGGNRDD